MERVYFITGVSGFLGQEILSLLAGKPFRHIYCFIRGNRNKTALERLEAILGIIGAATDGRISAIEGDLRNEKLGIDGELYERLCREVTHIIHSAADVRFNQPLESMRAINVGGAENILRFARDCRSRNPRFSHLDYVSTAFVAGRKARIVSEDDATDTYGFKNTYEQTKFESDMMVHAAASELPLIIYRPSIVVGVASTGKAKARNVIYPMLKLFRRWTWPIVPIRKDVRVDLIPVDFVARALLHISENEKNYGGRFHLAAGPGGDITLMQLLEIVEEEFGRHVMVLPVPVWRYIIRPILKTFKRSLFEKANPTFHAFESYVWEQGPRYDVTRTRRALAGSGIDLPSTEHFFRACLCYARESNFGERDPHPVPETNKVLSPV
jgi:long-chain acyl-CoA synthetase